MEKQYIDGLKDIAKTCALKRIFLNNQFKKSTNTQLIINIIGGLLSLIAAGVISMSLKGIFTSIDAQIIAIILSGTSSFLILLGFLSNKQTELINIHNGANDYLNLRDKSILTLKKIDEVDGIANLESVVKDYGILDRMYGAYLKKFRGSKIPTANDDSGLYLIANITREHVKEFKRNRHEEGQSTDELIEKVIE